MSNYPDGMNMAAFDRMMGAVATEAETAWEALAAQANDIVNRAYQEFPINSSLRRPLIASAMNKAREGLEIMVHLSDKDKHDLLEAYSSAIEFDVDHDHEAVSQMVGDYLFIYSRAINRAQGDAW